jgi:hypothetical protein
MSTLERKKPLTHQNSLSQNSLKNNPEIMRGQLKNIDQNDFESEDLSGDDKVTKRYKKFSSNPD